MQTIPWVIIQNTPRGKKLTKGGAHGEVTISDDGASVYKTVCRNNLGEISYEFTMEIISRDRCADVAPEISRLAPLQSILESPRAYTLQMRNIDGGDLWDLIQCDGIQGMMIKNIVRDIMQAVYVLHTRGVAHRDIKDANVLMENTSDGQHRAYLCDMSLATCSPHIVGDTFLPYTGRYRPPEVVRYGRTPNFKIDWCKADVYALGALLARLVAAKYWGSAVGSQPPTRKQTFNMPDFAGKNVVLAMLSENPTKRPSVIDAMLALKLHVDQIKELEPKPNPRDVVEDIVGFVREKDLPSWVSDIACDIYWAVPETDRCKRTCKFCVAIAAKLNVMVRERELLGRMLLRHGSDMKCFSGMVLRNDATRNAMHRLLRSDIDLPPKN